MKQRVLTTLALWLIVIGSLTLFKIYGGLVLILILSGIAQCEVYKLLRRIGSDPLPVVGVLAGSVLLILATFLSKFHCVGSPLATSVGLILPLIITAILVQTPVRHFSRRLFPTLIGFLLVPFCLSFLGLLATHPGVTANQGLFLAVWVVAVAKFSDVGALLVGRKIGRTKMAPEYSPKKTIEGAIGGIVCAILVGTLLPVLFPTLSPEALSFGPALIFSGLIAFISIVSDLLGSALKRQAQVKDSGVRVPGIGGSLDLLDSLLLTAPFGYALLSLILPA